MKKDCIKSKPLLNQDLSYHEAYFRNESGIKEE